MEQKSVKKKCKCKECKCKTKHKKKRLTEEDPTLINKTFSGLLNGSSDLKKVRENIEKDAGNFYVHVIKLAARVKALSPELMKDLKDLNFKIDSSMAA